MGNKQQEKTGLSETSRAIIQAGALTLPSILSAALKIFDEPFLSWPGKNETAKLLKNKAKAAQLEERISENIEPALQASNPDLIFPSLESSPIENMALFVAKQAIRASTLPRVKWPQENAALIGIGIGVADVILKLPSSSGHPPSDSETDNAIHETIFTSLDTAFTAKDPLATLEKKIKAEWAKIKKGSSYEEKKQAIAQTLALQIVESILVLINEADPKTDDKPGPPQPQVSHRRRNTIKLKGKTPGF